MNNEISYEPYAEVAGFAVITGRYLAKSVWIKYGKCTRQKRNLNKDKLFM
jgi:hypothetical protein